LQQLSAIFSWKIESVHVAMKVQSIIDCHEFRVLRSRSFSSTYVQSTTIAVYPMTGIAQMLMVRMKFPSLSFDFRTCAFASYIRLLPSSRLGHVWCHLPEGFPCISMFLRSLVLWYCYSTD
jgi:hypothetical protein